MFRHGNLAASSWHLPRGNNSCPACMYGEIQCQCEGLWCFHYLSVTVVPQSAQMANHLETSCEISMTPDGLSMDRKRSVCQGCIAPNRAWIPNEVWTPPIEKTDLTAWCREPDKSEVLIANCKATLMLAQCDVMRPMRSGASPLFWCKIFLMTRVISRSHQLIEEFIIESWR